VRREGGGADPPSHVLVLAALGAPQRRKLPTKHWHKAVPEPDPAPVSTGRATIIELEHQFADQRAAAAWIRGAGEPDLAAGLALLNRALHSFRLATADPHVNPVSRQQLLVARIGYGAGEEVADGLWTEARELLPRIERGSRRKVLHPQARLAALLGGREQALVCEELALRARLDLNSGRDREAALGLLVALDAVLAELAVDPILGERLQELRGQRDPVAEAAQAALAGPLDADSRETVGFTLGRIEAALRARAVASA